MKEKKNCWVYISRADKILPFYCNKRDDQLNGRSVAAAGGFNVLILSDTIKDTTSRVYINCSNYMLTNATNVPNGGGYLSLVRGLRRRDLWDCCDGSMDLCAAPCALVPGWRYSWGRGNLCNGVGFACGRGLFGGCGASGCSSGSDCGIDGESEGLLRVLEVLDPAVSGLPAAGCLPFFVFVGESASHAVLDFFGLRAGSQYF